MASDLKTIKGNPNATYWNIEDGYQSNANGNEDLYPYRVNGAGKSLRIQLGISIDDKHETACNEFAEGFILSLHAPDELPRLTEDFIHISPGHDVYISISPKVISTSIYLRRYTPHQRGCYFESERKLRYFQSYSQPKCEMECLSNFIRKRCDCVQFFLPSKFRNGKCDLKKKNN